MWELDKLVTALECAKFRTNHLYSIRDFRNYLVLSSLKVYMYVSVITYITGMS